MNFEPTDIPADTDGERTCGTCFERKELTQNFYKDGKDVNGVDKYRRDCKNCYRISRLNNRRMKRTPIVVPPPKKRGRKK